MLRTSLSDDFDTNFDSERDTANFDNELDREDNSSATLPSISAGRTNFDDEGPAFSPNSMSPNGRGKSTDLPSIMDPQGTATKAKETEFGEVVSLENPMYDESPKGENRGSTRSSGSTRASRRENRRRKEHNEDLSPRAFGDDIAGLLKRAKEKACVSYLSAV